MQPSQPQMAVVNPHDGAPPSSSLQFAETAGPSMSAEQQEKARAAVKAVTAAQEAQRWSQQPPPQVAQQPPPHRPFAAQTVPSTGTGAMPGVAQDPELVPEGAPRILAGFFVSYDTQPLGRVWPIFQGKSRVGRQGSAPDLDMEIEHPTASTRHALVLAAACPGRVKIEDTGSTNGTFVNGTRLPVGARHELRDGDRVRFGLLATIVKII